MSVLKRTLAIGAAALLLPLSACGFVYHAEPIEGWVVDAETNQPLEGVNIVAHWQLRGGVMEDNPIAQIHIDEAVTDRNGRYAFKGWGPKFALLGHLRDETPGLMFFKSGYKYFGTSNMPGSDTSKSDWNKKTVKLEKFKGTLAEYAKHVGRLNSELTSIGQVWGDPCGWESFLSMIHALDVQAAEFERAGFNYGSVGSRIRSNAKNLQAAGCGSMEEILK